MIYRRVEEAAFWTERAFWVVVPRSLRVKRLEVVEVAATVRTERTSAEVVPIATLSVWVWRRTKVPSSWKPETLVAEIAEQMMLPDPSVVKALEEEQVGMVEIWMPPPATIRPEASVEVAPVLVWRKLPPEMESSPAKVLVAVEEELSPPKAWRSPEIARRLAKVEEAEWKALVREVSPLTAREEEAEIAPPT